PRAAAALPQFDLTKIPLTEAAFTRSIQVYQRAAAANPRDAEAHYWLGVAYWEASLQHRNMLIPYGDGYLDKSIAELERAVKIDDNYLAAWQLLAAAYPTRGTSLFFSLGGLFGLSDDQKGWQAAQKLIILTQKQSIAYGGAPQPKGGGGVAPASPPAAPGQTAPPPPTTAPPTRPTMGIVAFALGLIVGSFVNVCIYRLPRHESVVWPGSHCPHCQAPIRWYDNIPLLSFALLGGRCRRCRTPISWRYPLVEFLTAALFVQSVAAFGVSPRALQSLVLGTLLLIVFFVDLDHS